MLFRSRRALDSIGVFTSCISSACGPIVESEDFELIVVIVILVNCVSLALYRPTEGTGSEWNERLDRLELGLNGFFTLELVLRISHRGAGEYFRDPWNRFDFALVLAGYSGLLIAAPQGGADTGDGDNGGLRALRALRALQALRALRLLRVFKLLKAWRSLQRLLASLLRALRPLAWLMLLFALILFIFALLGMQFFGGQFLPPKWPLPPRPNFDSIGSSMLAVSVVATMEDWNSVWLNAHRAAGGMSALYFVALLVVGSFLLMNLIIATLIGSFDAADSDSPVQASPPGSMMALSVSEPSHMATSGPGS